MLRSYSSRFREPFPTVIKYSLQESKTKSNLLIKNDLSEARLIRLSVVNTSKNDLIWLCQKVRVPRLAFGPHFVNSSIFCLATTVEQKLKILPEAE